MALISDFLVLIFFANILGVTLAPKGLGLQKNELLYTGALGTLNNDRVAISTFSLSKELGWIAPPPLRKLFLRNNIPPNYE